MCRQQVLQHFCTYSEHEGDGWYGTTTAGNITMCSAKRRTGTCNGIQPNSTRSKIIKRCEPCNESEQLRQDQMAAQDDYYIQIPHYDDDDKEPNYTYGFNNPYR
jgi:hypothetical protein